MKALNAIGRFITSPMGAVLLCAAGSFALWFGLEPHRGAAPKANPPGKLGTGTPATTKRGSDTDGRKNAVSSRSGPGPRSRKPRGGTVANRSNAEATDREIVEPEESPATDPSPAPAKVAAAVDHPDRRPEAAGGGSTAASAPGTIDPRDPRAPALGEYRTKKAAVSDAAPDQKQLARWCDTQGLWEEAKTHWKAVVRLDPKNDEARRRLGYRMRGRDWVLDAASAEAMVQEKANAYWKKALQKYHAQMKCRSKVAVPGRNEAVAHVEAIGDPRAAAEIWKGFAADTSHHGLIVGILGRFQTPEASQMLAALAVYSRDDKARVAAVAALRGRKPAEYGERLITLMHNPMRVEERQVPVPGRDPVRQLFVEGDTANYRFLFAQAVGPGSQSQVGCFQPQLSPGEVQFARQFNENQAAMARSALDRQVERAKEMIEKYNDAIRALNERVARVLNEASDAGMRSEPEDGRRWLAAALGTAYQPASDRAKPTITEIVSPLYSPTFLPTPAST